MSVNVSSGKYLLGIWDEKYGGIIKKQHLTKEIEAHKKDVKELKVEILDLKKTQGI